MRFHQDIARRAKAIIQLSLDSCFIKVRNPNHHAWQAIQ
jgi:hypothetical protein